MVRKSTVFVYGVVSYLVGFVCFLYMMGFLGNMVVPKTIDAGVQGPLWVAMLVNTGLLTLFGIQHSIMARPAFKRVWTKIIPPEAERSTYVLLSGLLLFAAMVFWRPMGGVVWHVENTAARAAISAFYWAGWLILFATTFLLNHFHLFGLQQVWTYLRGRECAEPMFSTPLWYRWVRHPLYVGWFIIFWAAPTMTGAHLAFAVVTTAYILIAIPYEENDLIQFHGEAYRRYRETVPMFLPLRFGKSVPRPREADANSA